jgi:hypothetical protein
VSETVVTPVETEVDVTGERDAGPGHVVAWRCARPLMLSLGHVAPGALAGAGTPTVTESHRPRRVLGLLRGPGASRCTVKPESS